MELSLVELTDYVRTRPVWRTKQKTARIKSRLRDWSCRLPANRRLYLKRARKLAFERFVAKGPRKKGQGLCFAILNHNYDLDIDAFCQADSDHTIWAMSLDLFQGWEEFFPSECRDLNCVYGSGKMAAYIQHYKKAFAVSFVEKLIEVTQLNAAIVPSDIFYWFRPIIEELQFRRIPVLVQDKEGTIAPGALMERYAKLFAERYPPVADQYYFWNCSQLNFWQKVGLNPTKAFVLGQPRSDFFFHQERWPSKVDLGIDPHKKLVVAFTFAADAYVETVPGMTTASKTPWLDLRNQFHAALRDFAARQPDIQIVIKAHPQQWDLEAIRQECERHYLPNVLFMSGAATASHLLVRADVITGFQTTALIEAMLTDKPIIYAGWEKAHNHFASMLLPIHLSGGVAVAEDQSHFKNLLSQAIEGRLQLSLDMIRRRQEFTEQHFHQADGACAKRVLEAAATYVHAYTASSQTLKRLQ